MNRIDEIYFRKTLTTLILISLLVLSFLILRPILMAIVIALILAFIFSPVYDLFVKKIKSRNLSAGIIIALLLVLIILPLWFLIPLLIEQSFKIFQFANQVDFIDLFKRIFPALFASEQFSAEVGSIIGSFTRNTANFLVNSFASIILDLPRISLQLVVVFFSFFFFLRDKDNIINYLKSLSPFSKEIEKKLFEYSKGIASSVIYGQAIVGAVQGIIAGIGFFIFGVPNALFLSLFAILAGVFPVIGTFIIWAPVVIYLLIAQSNFAAIGVLIFGILSSSIDNFLRPLIVSQRTDIHTGIIIIGMIGGLFLFGILGLILGPLILAYLIVILELYRKRNVPEILIKQEPAQ